MEGALLIQLSSIPSVLFPLHQQEQLLPSYITSPDMTCLSRHCGFLLPVLEHTLTTTSYLPQVHSDLSLYLKCWSRLPKFSTPTNSNSPLSVHFPQPVFMLWSHDPKNAQHFVCQLFLLLPISTQPHGMSLFSSLISPLRSRSRLTAPTAYLLTLLPCPTRYISILTYRSPQSLRAGFCLSACCLYIGSFIVFKSNSKLPLRRQKSSSPIPALSFSYIYCS